MCALLDELAPVVFPLLFAWVVDRQAGEGSATGAKGGFHDAGPGPFRERGEGGRRAAACGARQRAAACGARPWRRWPTGGLGLAAAAVVQGEGDAPCREEHHVHLCLDLSFPFSLLPWKRLMRVSPLGGAADARPPARRLESLRLAKRANGAAAVLRLLAVVRLFCFGLHVKLWPQRCS